LVEIGKQRVPLKQIMHDKEIREAMAGLEKFRQRFNEKEFFYGAKVYLSYGEGDCWAVIKRPETDKEYAARQLYLQEQQQKKAERLRLKQLKEYAAEQKRIAEAAARKRQEEAEELQRALEIAQKYGYKLVDKLDS
jgi:dihydroorotase-like cyclic amidohydrolase